MFISYGRTGTFYRKKTTKNNNNKKIYMCLKKKKKKAKWEAWFSYLFVAPFLLGRSSPTFPPLPVGGAKGLE